MGILRPITSIGSGVLVYKVLDKYADPLYPMPWAGVPYLNRMELSNTVSLGTGALAALMTKYSRGMSSEAKQWLAEYAVTSAVMGVAGLFFTPAMYVVSGPPMPGITTPAVSPYSMPRSGQAISGMF